MDTKRVYVRHFSHSKLLHMWPKKHAIISSSIPFISVNGISVAAMLWLICDTYHFRCSCCHSLEEAESKLHNGSLIQLSFSLSQPQSCLSSISRLEPQSLTQMAYLLFSLWIVDSRKDSKATKWLGNHLYVTIAKGMLRIHVTLALLWLTWWICVIAC